MLPFRPSLSAVAGRSPGPAPSAATASPSRAGCPQGCGGRGAVAQVAALAPAFALAALLALPGAARASGEDGGAPVLREGRAAPTRRPLVDLGAADPAASTPGRRGGARATGREDGKDESKAKDGAGRDAPADPRTGAASPSRGASGAEPRRPVASPRGRTADLGEMEQLRQRIAERLRQIKEQADAPPPARRAAAGAAPHPRKPAASDAASLATPFTSAPALRASAASAGGLDPGERLVDGLVADPPRPRTATPEASSSDADAAIASPRGVPVAPGRAGAGGTPAGPAAAAAAPRDGTPAGSSPTATPAAALATLSGSSAARPPAELRAAPPPASEPQPSTPTAPAAPTPPTDPKGLPWAYAGPAGPSAWGRLKPDYALCGRGQRQSPIDLRDGLAVDLDPLLFDYPALPITVLDTGHGLQVTVRGTASVSLRGQRYLLQRMSFHRPGQGSVDGRRAPMSVELLHRDAQGRLLIVALNVEAGAAQPVVQQVLNNLPLEVGSQQAAAEPVSLSGLLPAEPAGLGYWTYMGSLTEPPCTEGVLWVVLKRPITLSADQLALFARLHADNARPNQPVAGRRIKVSR